MDRFTGSCPNCICYISTFGRNRQSEHDFNNVFFILVNSIFIQGTTLSVVAKWLGVAIPEKAKKLSPTDLLFSEVPKTIMREILVGLECYCH